MSRPKLRKMAKNIKNQPRLKKILAEYLTKRTFDEKNYNAYSMLLNGHRGFLAMSEKELTDKFDNVYIELEEEVKAAEKDRLEEDPSSWGVGYLDGRVKDKKKILAKADKIYDEIFEELFL